jgi:hypothetical protein
MCSEGDIKLKFYFIDTFSYEMMFFLKYKRRQIILKGLNKVSVPAIMPHFENNPCKKKFYFSPCKISKLLK